MVESDSLFTKTPFLIVIIRMILAPLFFLSYIYKLTIVALALYLAVSLSDILDGYVARRQNILPASPMEAYLDPVADFIFVLFSFLAFSLSLIYPIWVLFILLFMFLFFLASSSTQEPLYDPIGKYYGIFLFGTIGVTLLFPLDIVLDFVLILIMFYTVVLFICRIVYLWKGRLENKNLNS
ncbi:MAG: CDP-alcohol phosphatidyltransferase family protein [Candidatus Thorarchaeota archaeon]|nr:CDP-alcohol phosphatidyltransferase family protein [Candidatus Thorarchaeota archaeon]